MKFVNGLLISYLLLSVHSLCAEEVIPAMPQEQALAIAESSSEVKALYSLKDDFAQCIEKRLVRPCDSGWVTCIDDAWVAEFLVRENCFKHDGRLGIRLLIDKDGKIISRYPEVNYFNDSQYCLDPNDCFYQESTQQSLNFIYGQIREGFKKCEDCECLSNKCMKHQ